jgi:predicted transcriptional regulator
MTTVELLQQIGLNKYEAEAYYTLLANEPLTGYELGKRSQVPLSRSYEVLERLTEKGLALVQPGDPPRYTAQDPQQFLEHVRHDLESTLGALTAALSSLPHADITQEFWVVRGRQNILARVRAMIAATQATLNLSMPADCYPTIADELAQARQRGCHIFQTTTELQQPMSDSVLVLCDDHEALVGMVVPVEGCQAVVSSHIALRTTLSSYFSHQHISGTTTTQAPTQPASPHDQQDDHDWVDWEIRKQRHLWSLSKPDRVA